MKRLKYRADSRLPIIKPILQDSIRILPVVCTNAFETNLFSAAFSLASHGLLRVGEVIIDIKKGDKHITIQLENLSISHNTHSLLLSIRYSN
jgi:coenzyme F420-reducing hydrogenase delta subunit